MKRLLLLAAILLLPTMVLAGEKSSDNYWFCYQVGVVKENSGKKKAKYKSGESTLVISNIFKDNLPNHYDDREKQFAKKVAQTTNGTFYGHFEPQCTDTGDAARAAKHRQKKVDRAQKRDYTITPIQFVYKPSEE